MTDFQSVSGKVAIVTGAGSGMGKAIAKTFAENGMKVVIADFNEQTGKAVADLITAEGGDAAFIKTDVSKEDSVKAMVAFAVEKYGRLDGIVNNAGMGTPEAPSHKVPMSDYDTVIGIDQTGVFLGIKYGAEAILNSMPTHGFIINTASTGGLNGNEGMILYIAAKHAVVGMTQTAALDYARHNITVNAICPGPVKTEIWGNAPQEYIDSYAKKIPINRLMEPQEIANLALFLASDLATNITGQAIVADGGCLAGGIQNLEW